MRTGPNSDILRTMRFLLPALFLALLSLPATAQEFNSYTHSGGSTYKNETADEIRRLQRQSMTDKGFIKPQVIEVSLIRPSYLEDDQFAIQMVVPDVVSGCWNISPLEYESSFIDPFYFDVTVKHYQRNPVETNNVTSGCPTQNKMSSAMIVLNRKDLEGRQIRQIRFSNGSISDYYDIRFSADSLQLKPQSMVIFKAKGMSGPLADYLEIGFGAGGKVALHVPMARQNDDIRNAIVAMASRHGLTPDPDAPMSYSAGGSPVFYFTDQIGDVAGTIGEDGYSELGTVDAARPYDGENGRMVTPVPLKVFVTRPGTQL